MTIICMFLVWFYWHHHRKIVSNTWYYCSLLVSSLPLSSWQKHLTFGSEVLIVLFFFEIFSWYFTSLLYITLKISWNLDNCPLTLAKERIRPQFHEDQVTKFQFSSVVSFLMSAWARLPWVIISWAQWLRRLGQVSDWLENHKEMSRAHNIQDASLVDIFLLWISETKIISEAVDKLIFW